MDKVFSRRLVAPKNMQIVNPALLTDLSPFIHYSFFPSLPRCRPMCVGRSMVLPRNGFGTFYHVKTRYLYFISYVLYV